MSENTAKKMCLACERTSDETPMFCFEVLLREDEGSDQRPVGVGRGRCGRCESDVHRQGLQRLDRRTFRPGHAFQGNILTTENWRRLARHLYAVVADDDVAEGDNTHIVLIGLTRGSIARPNAAKWDIRHA